MQQKYQNVTTAICFPKKTLISKTNKILLKKKVHKRKMSLNLVYLSNLNIKMNTQSPFHWILIHLPPKKLMTLNVKIFDCQAFKKHNHLHWSSRYIIQKAIHIVPNPHKKSMNSFFLLIFDWLWTHFLNTKKNPNLKFVDKRITDTARPLKKLPSVTASTFLLDFF